MVAHTDEYIRGWKAAMETVRSWAEQDANDFRAKKARDAHVQERTVHECQAIASDRIIFRIDNDRIYKEASE